MMQDGVVKFATAVPLGTELEVRMICRENVVPPLSPAGSDPDGYLRFSGIAEVCERPEFPRSPTDSARSGQEISGP